MATIAETLSQRIQETVDQRFNWNYWLLDNLTGTKLRMIWVAVLALATVGLTIRQLIQSPAATTVTLVFWLIGIVEDQQPVGICPQPFFDEPNGRVRLAGIVRQLQAVGHPSATTAATTPSASSRREANPEKSPSATTCRST